MVRTIVRNVHGVCSIVNTDDQQTGLTISWTRHVHINIFSNFGQIHESPQLPRQMSIISQSTHAQRERAETYLAKINVMDYHGAVLDNGF